MSFIHKQNAYVNPRDFSICPTVFAITLRKKMPPHRVHLVWTRLGEKTGQLSPSDTGGTRWARGGWTATSAAATGAAATRRSGLSVVEVRGFLIRCGMGSFLTLYLYGVYTGCTPVNKYDAVCLYWWLRKIRQKIIVDMITGKKKQHLLIGSRYFLKISKYWNHWGQWRFE